MKVYLIAPRDGSSECPQFAHREQAEEVARMVSRWIGKCRVEEIVISNHEKPSMTPVALFTNGARAEEPMSEWAAP